MPDRLKAFITQTQAGVAQFSDIDLAERHCKLNAPGDIYLRCQVTEIIGTRGLALHAHDSKPFRSF